MKDFCGVNGCYDNKVSEESEVVSVYVNSLLTYEADGKGEYIRTLPENRTYSDIDFIFELPNEDGDCYITKFTVYTVGNDGVQAFVSMLMKEQIDTKNRVIEVVKTLLEQPGAIWGKVSLDDEEQNDGEA
ncbi:MAG: hypothetical protein H6Q68_2855 [Firmicutes bacterium]|nr:hypothetical protein [Bacillota bacterium]